MIIEKTYTLVRLKPIKGFIITKRIETKTDDPWDINNVASIVDLHKYSYFWFDNVRMVKEQEDWGFTFISNIVDSSGKFFVNGYVEEYDDVLVNNKRLAEQMKNLDWTHIVKNIGEKECWVEHFDPDQDKLVEI